MRGCFFWGGFLSFSTATRSWRSFWERARSLTPREAVPKGCGQERTPEGSPLGFYPLLSPFIPLPGFRVPQSPPGTSMTRGTATRTSWELSEKGLNSSRPLWLVLVSCVTEGSCGTKPAGDDQQRAAAPTPPCPPPDPPPAPF